MRIVICAAALSLLCSCGTDLPANPQYQGAWTAFEVNGSSSLGGFQVDDHGRFQFTAGSAQVSGAIAPGGTLSGSVSSLFGGGCVLGGRCVSINACSGTTQGTGCPQDNSGAPWSTFSLCRGNSC